MAIPGTVFQLVPEGGNHFWIVISKEKDGLVLAVNFTDGENWPDSPCLLQPGEHPEIKKPSTICYRRAHEFESQKIDALCAQGTLVRQLANFSPALLQRVIDGAKKADDLTLRFLDYLE